MNLIEDYVENILLPQLIYYGANVQSASEVKRDIKYRLASVINLWKQPEIRNTILLTGLEEAYYYKPDADLLTKSLVVVAIRNSLIEDMKSTLAAARRLGLSKVIIDDKLIREITGKAINYFNKHDPNTVAISLVDNANNPYIDLSSKYPIAWEAIKNLSQCKSYTKYNPIECDQASSTIFINPKMSDGMKTVEVQSGIDPTITDQLQHILNFVMEGKQPFFFSDSFKMISRNVDKLFKVLNIVLSSNAPVVTVNYYISNGYVAKRSNLLRPAHFESEVIDKIKDVSGLRKTHAAILKSVKASIED
ncbi:hypothetical protein PaecuDRAFT_3554 [Paenibacillus curdlanolyticus YK9]|uniref:Uncharacterized protein n=1 Tax=Paenibacillus curdlanolyticus YK9 TaxID=717606 RepID=E0ID52_9BACL|nr:hypothetical protein [Paenibacillus curdlanolyticus]EFM09507.1 hypothetical protein PaecuDRAFT_3554 [Paenibacillus curdlanolyticus YK9]